MAIDSTLTSPPVDETNFDDTSFDDTLDIDPPIELDWETIKPPEDLIFDDGEPLESNRHRIAMNALIQSAYAALGDRTDFFAGGNMFIYYSREQVKNRDFRGPDFFAVLEVDGDKERQGWVVWDENGRYPDVIVELMSRSTETTDLNLKKDLYERTFRTRHYLVYHPFKPNSLQGWVLNQQQRYEPLQPNDQGRLWCDSLGVWFGLWEGRIDREPPVETCYWLRLFDVQGNLIPLPVEQAQQERQRADQAQQQAEQAQQQAEQAQQQAEQAQQQAEQERLRAEVAEQRANQLAERLRALGLSEDA